MEQADTYSPEQVARVADALYRAEWLIGDPPLNESSPAIQAHYRELALTAIRSLRLPIKV